MARLDPYRLPLSGRHLIEASAGTGKTYNAVILWIRASLEWDLMPHQVLMVTFTRAATAELQQRLQQRIDSLLAHLDRPEDDPLAAHLLSQFDQDELQHKLLLRLQTLDDAAVTTLHGWAGQAVREFDRLVPFEVSDALPALKARAMETVWAECEAALGERALWLTQSLGSPEKALTTLGNLFNFKARALQPSVSIDEAQALALAELHQSDVDQIEAHKKPAKPHRETLRQAIEHGDLMAIANIGDSHKFITPFSDLIQACKRLQGALWRDLFLRWEHQFEQTKTLQRLAEPDDQVKRLRDALGDAEFAQTLAERWPVALVDEFQDTDPDQLAILQRVYDGRGTLLMIGDPKQALYSFRGGDIAAYQRARRWVDADNIHSIDQCFRMSEALVAGLNQAYEQQPDPFSGDADYQSIDAGRDEGALILQGQAMAPIQWLEVSKASKDALEKAANACAALLQAGASKPDGQRLRPGDIAILVNRWDDGKALREALAPFGIGARLKAQHARGGEGYQSFAHFALACAEPSDSRKARATVPYAVSGIHRSRWSDFRDQPDATLALMQRIQHCHEQWLQKGPLAAARAFVHSGPDLDQLQSQEFGLAAIAEFLDLAERIDAPHPMDAVRWCRRPDRNKQHMPQPSDNEAVVITTIHSAKGLEYPVVLVPVAPSTKKSAFFIQSDGQQTLIDLAPEPHSQARQQQQAEAEAQRLLYVAVTRAKHFLILGGSEKCQLGQHWRREAAVPFALTPRGTKSASQDAPLAIPPGLDNPYLNDAWRVHSFSGWIQGVDLPRAERADHDLDGPAGRYPKGPQAGDLLHRLLDWRLQGQLSTERATPLLTALGVSEADDILAWIEDIVQAPILPGQHCLAEVTTLPEMDFHLALGRVNAETVDRIIQADWPMAHRTPLPKEQLVGLMKGSLDVTLEADGRYWVLDYKSNFLGSQEDYTEANMLAQVAHHRYDLQAGLYLVALHRLLAQRMPDYQPARHLGGAIYHFVRVPTACVRWEVTPTAIQALDQALTGAPV